MNQSNPFVISIDFDSCFIGWCNGFLFSFDVFQTDYLIKKQADGILYLDTLVYAESEKIENSKWNGYSIEVIDFSGYDTIEKLIESIVKNNVKF